MADEVTPVEQPKILLKFRASQKSPTLEINNGEYARHFAATEQPFEVESDEEAQMLLRTGYFVHDKEAEKVDGEEQSEKSEELLAAERGQTSRAKVKETKLQGKIGGAPANETAGT